ncbi:MAG: hypothetical protein Q8784_00330 [Vigna little leaf phytoplasma]|nr:hypothetical protein [Vigna little leaf phytoplasma]
MILKRPKIKFFYCCSLMITTIIFITSFLIVKIILFKNEEKIEHKQNTEKIEYKNPNTIPEEKKIARKLALLGLQQIIKVQKLISSNEIQNEMKTNYQIILEAEDQDTKTIFDQVLNGKLSTANRILIQGTLDFLAQKLNKKIILNIEKYNKNTPNSHNDQLISYVPLSNSDYIELNMRNIDNNHFYILEPTDTLGDGYCFFYALKYLLDKKYPSWIKYIHKELEELHLKF